MNENYAHPAMPKGAEEGILKGMYVLQKAKKPQKAHVQLLGSGTILREVLKAAEILKTDFNVSADIWSVTSFNELYREARDVERHNLLHPEAKPKQAYVTQCLQKQNTPVVAATDYICAYADQIRAFINNPYRILGTDGFGRSDTRAKLRHFFEVDAKYIVLSALKSLADIKTISSKEISKAIKKYKIDINKPNPVSV